MGLHRKSLASSALLVLALLATAGLAVGCSSSTSSADGADVTSTADGAADSVAADSAAVDGAESADAGPTVVESAPVSVVGDPVIAQPDDVLISVDPETDPAIGSVAPTLTGVNFEGEPIEIGTDGQPTIVFFVTHWCGHCQAEVPEIQALVDAGSIPAGVRIVGVSTALIEDRDNYPPSAWFANESWTSDVMVDNETDAMGAFGGTAFPYAVYLDAGNTIVARTIGSVGPTQIVQLAERIAE